MYQSCIKGKVFYLEGYEVDCEYRKVPLGLINKYHVKIKLKATALLISNLLCIILGRLSKSYFTHMNHLILAEYNSINMFFFFLGD